MGRAPFFRFDPNMDEHNYIFGTKPHDLDASKEVKMRIPIAHLIRLHGLKLLTGQNISDTVARALELYFREVEAEKATAHATTAAAIATMSAQGGVAVHR